MSTDHRTALTFDSRTVLKENEVFLVCDPAGNIRARSREGQGLYFRDTRYLSLYELTIEEFDLWLLSSAGDQPFMGNLQLANLHSERPNGSGLPIGARTISVRRNRFILDGLHERIGFFNYNPFQVEVTVRLALGSDFRDMFEVRGYARRHRRGMVAQPVADEHTVTLSYVGLDGVQRRTEIAFDPTPTTVELLGGEEHQEAPPAGTHLQEPRAEQRVTPPHAVATFRVALPPNRPISITLHAVPSQGAPRPRPFAMDRAYADLATSYREWGDGCTEIETNDELFDAVLRRAQSDLRLLMNRYPSGRLPAAGIPWFSVPFGRDSLITSYQTLMLGPDLAYGTLRYLAAHQGSEFDDWRDEEPGKIVHEVRLGEMASTGEVPHDSYYGTADATPLFVILLSELVRWTGDWRFAEELKGNLIRALEWIRRHGDPNGDLFIEYLSRSKRGLRNQGWKDSANSTRWRDGSPVEPPVAAVEVQGYAYDARLRAAELARGLGDSRLAAELREEAELLKQRFEECFWIEDEQYFAQALDGEGRPVPVVASNAGHCLWSGIVPEGKQDVLVGRLMSPELLSGWGIRTLSRAEPGFNPMSYHNGSVWPHDNSLIMTGLKRHGYDAEAGRVFTEVYQAALRFPGYRLPELYCGFDRDRHYQAMPAQYPVSCSPQAWSAGALFLMLQEALGLRPDAASSTLHVRPVLPPWLNRVALRRLKVGEHDLSLEFLRRGDHVEIDLSMAGNVRVIVDPKPRQ